MHLFDTFVGPVIALKQKHKSILVFKQNGAWQNS